MLIFAIIHNQSLGPVKEVADSFEATRMAQDSFKEKIGREMNEEEREDWEIYQEVINMDDSDNHWTFSIGKVE